jgi:predicted permease
VRAAGITTVHPFGSGNTLVTIEVEGRAEAAPPSVNYRLVTPGLFAALGLPVVRGRPLAASDAAGAGPVVVVSAAMAARYWPGESPIGRRVRRAGDGEPWLTVVGVAGDVRESAETDTQETRYVPYAQGAPRTAVSFATLNAVVVVRAAGDPAALTTALRRAVAEVDDAVPVHTVATLDRLRADAFAEQRLGAALTGAFAALGLLLAALGLHAVMAYATARRTREIGIRLALGASGVVVLREVLARSARLVALGLALGLGAALALTHHLRGLLAEVGPRDPLVLGTVATVLVMVGLLAAWVPARRAARVEPVVALRGE